MSDHSPHLVRRLLPGLAGLLILAWSSAPPARAQSAGGWVPRMAAEDETLWLVQVSVDQSRAYRRTLAETFTSGDLLNARLVRLGPAAGRLYGVVADARLYVLRDLRWNRGLDLPTRALPLDLAGSGAALYALVPSPPAGILAERPPGERAATTQPFDPGGAALSVVRLDSLGWTAVAACPPELVASADPRLTPRLELRRDQVRVYGWNDAQQRLEYAALDESKLVWTGPRPVPGLGAHENLAAFWVTSVSGVPTLVVATAPPGGSDTLHVYRSLKQGTEDEWRPAPPRLSALPDGVVLQRFHAVAGFNQHLALLVSDVAGRSFVQFGRIEAEPAEETLDVDALFAGGAGQGRGPTWLQSLTVAVLFVTLLSLFIFRRSAMVESVALPPDRALALTFQRLLGLGVDLAPWAFLVGAVMGVNVLAAAQSLFGWAAGADVSEARFPTAQMLVWWGTTIGVHTLYAVVLELAWRRTLGKLLLGTYLMSDTGAPASAVQVLVRNLLRLVELLPPLWVLGFLVVLSRNRQRVGDVFARTIVVRRVFPARTESPRPPDGSDDA